MVTIMVITPPSPLCMQDSEVFGASAPYVISGNKLLTFLERLKDGLVRVKREGGGGRQQYKGESTWEGGSEVGGGGTEREKQYILILHPPLPRFGGLHETPVWCAAHQSDAARCGERDDDQHAEGLEERRFLRTQGAVGPSAG